MSRDHQDALIEQLLRENLGGDRPRDLTPRVIAMARAYDHTRRSWWISAGAAMAASIVIAIGLFFYMRSYPDPTIDSGNITLINGGPGIQRGAPLGTPEDQGGTMTIGGYAQVKVAANTTFTLGGEKRKEVVFLEQGHIDVAVKKGHGSFDVVVEDAVVHVTGTRFNVDVSWVPNDEESRLDKKMRVDVDEGSVEVSLNGKEKRAITPGNPLELTISSAGLQPQGQTLSDPSAPDADAHAPQEKAPGTAPEPRNSSPETRAEEPKGASPANQTNGPAGRAETNPRNGARGAAAVGAGGRGSIARGAATRRTPAVDQRMIPLRVIVGPATIDFNGVFLKIDTYYVLNTGREFILLGTGADDLPKGSAIPASKTRVQVRFSKGKVQSITAIPTTRPAGRTPEPK